MAAIKAAVCSNYEEIKKKKKKQKKKQKQKKQSHL
jgi:hypothetical protein